MKSHLSSYLLASLAVLAISAGALQAQLIYSDPMSYADGDITTNSSGAWVKHSNANNLDSLEANGRYEINEQRADDIHRWFSPGDTNGYLTGALWASFTIRMTSLPSNGAGTYFAHFMDS